MTYSPTKAAPVCPDHPQAKLRDEPKAETYRERVCAHTEAPPVSYTVTVTERRCPRCQQVVETNSDHQRKRAEAVRNFWLKYVFAAGCTWKDVERVREMVQKVTEDGTLDPLWFAEWLCNGG